MKSSKIKVCLVVHGIVGGGSEQVILNYCSRMKDIQFDMLFQYEPNSQILERFQEANIICIQVPDKVHHPIKHLWAMYRQLKAGHYDVVHSHLDWYMNAYVCFLAMLAGVKTRIAHHHQAYHPTNPLVKMACILLRIPNKIFATHWFACGNAAAKSGWGKSAVAKGKVTILPNAVDPKRFEFDTEKRNAIRSQLGISENTICIGHVGRFYPEKNHHFLLDIFIEYHKINTKSKLLLVGDGPLQEEIENRAKKENLQDCIVFVGLQKDVAPYYCAMDTLLLPSIREAFPMTLVEAQYNGLDCVVSSAVPPEVFISNGVKSLPIDKTKAWVEELEKIKLRESVENKNNRIADIKSKDYDINRSGIKLQRLYCNSF